MYDLILKGGTVVDGTRSAPYVADVAVKDGRIAKISVSALSGAREIIDVSGRIVSPGFVDMHSHSDFGGPFIPVPCVNKIMQGITTDIGGNCGDSPCPFPEKYLEAQKKRLGCAVLSTADYRDYTEKHGSAANIGFFTGHANLRISVVDYSARVPSASEMRQMEDLLEKQMKEGSLGMSLGLIYPPSAFGKTEEIVNLAKVVAKNDGALSVHMRNENARIFEAIKEMLEVAERSGVRLEISHFKLMGEDQWGMSGKALEMIEDARARGIRVTADQYPYLAACTGLGAMVPQWAHEGGREALLSRLKTAGDDIKQGIMENLRQWGGAKGTLINKAAGHPEYQDKYLSQVSEELGLPVADTLIKVILDTENYTTCCYFCMSEGDLLEIMKKDYVAVGTDAWGGTYDRSPGNLVLHPRFYNTYPRFFQYVREKKLMPIEDAVYKCTALPAGIAGIRERGMIKEGYFADITVFDRDNIKDTSTYSESREKPAGIDLVLVNGKTAVKNNTVQNDRAGTFICPGR